LDVFLDVDNLVQGAFDQQLWSTMGRAKNVVLVWSKGCMDRFLDGNDPTCQGNPTASDAQEFLSNCAAALLNRFCSQGICACPQAAEKHSSCGT
jgi:hypothetical protein